MRGVYCLLVVSVSAISFKMHVEKIRKGMKHQFAKVLLEEKVQWVAEEEFQNYPFYVSVFSINFFAF